MDLLKLLALGVGGYFLYEYLYGNSTTASSTTPITTTSSVPTTGIVVSTPVVTPVSSIALLQLSGGVNSLAVDQWNYYYQQLTGKALTVDGLTFGLASATTPINVTQYLSYIQGAGLGMIIDLNSLFKGASPGKGVGGREFNAAANKSGVSRKEDFSVGFSKALGMIVNDPANSAAYIDETGMIDAASFNGSINDGDTTDFYLAVEGQGN